MKGQLAQYITYDTSPPAYDVAMQQTGKILTISGLLELNTITVSGIVAVIARQYAQMGDETPEAYIGRLILKDQWERRDAEAME